MDVALIAPVRAYREALASAISSMPGIDVVCQAPTISEGLGRLSVRSPSVTLVDFGLENVVAAIASVRSIAPATRLIAIGIGRSVEQSSAVVQAARTGVAGFLDSDQSVSEIVEAVRVVTRGESPCSPRIVALLLQALRYLPELSGHMPSQFGRPTLTEPLTPRERLVAELAARGMTNREIASQLQLGESTVKTHMHAVLRKLDLTSRDQLVSVPSPRTPVE